MFRSQFSSLARRAALLTAVIGGHADGTPHPTALLTNHGKTIHPVIKVLGTDPIVSIDGKDVRIRNRSIFFAERAPRYADPTADLKDVSLNGTVLKAVVNESDDPERSGALIGGTSFFEARLTSSAELIGSYIALIVFDSTFLDGRTDQPETEIILHELPVIRAGIEIKIKFTAPLVGSGSRKAFVPILFAAGGAEIRTGFWSHAARYFSRIEQIKLRQAIGEYRAKFSNQDHEAVPFVRVSPILPSGMAAPSGDLAATLMINATGSVTSVRFSTDGPNDLTRALADALSGWLFLPKLKTGEPVACQVVLPFRF